MKSSLGKLGRKLTIHHKNDGKEKRDQQPPAHFDELAQASKDMQDMRNCYDSLLSAAAATANSIYELSESLQEMGSCLLDKTTLDADGESGRVISTLGSVQSELQKVADSYRSHVILTITNPSESLLSELRKVEEMKLQCDEKREVYEYMMAHHREKGKLRSGKAESSTAQQVQEAHDEYDSVARLCVFRLKSLKEGQCRSILTQATRHHVAQLNFFRKGLKALEAVDPLLRLAAEKYRIDYQLNGLDDGEEREGEVSGCGSADDGELSFDYRRNKQGSDNIGTSTNLMEVDIPYPQVPTLEDAATNFGKNQGELRYSRQPRSSFSAPLSAEKPDPAERTKEQQSSARKVHSYVLPAPVNTKISDSRNSISAPYSSQTHKPLHLLPLDRDKHEKGYGDSNVLPCATFHAQSIAKESNGNNSSVQLPTPLVERFSLPQRDSHNALDSKKVKRQAYSGPLASKPFLSKPYASTSGPITSAELPQLVSGSLSRVPISQPPTSPNVSRSASPPPLSSPKISELHELPRPPSSLSTKPASSSGSHGHSSPLFFRNQELSLTNKTPAPTVSAPSPLPPPPLTVPRSFSIPSCNQRAMALSVGKLLESPQIPGRPKEVASPPLTPISLSNMKSLSTVSELASNSGQI